MRLRTMAGGIAALMLGAAAAPGTAQEGATVEGPVPTAAATLIGLDGESLGSATFMDTPSGVLIEINAEGLPEGRLGLHLHETGACDPDTGFESAGGHFNPAGADHGFLSPDGPHAGDLPNQTVGADGTLSVTVLATLISLSEEEPTDARLARTNILGGDGAALVVHSGPDDYLTDPDGDAGDRLACGVIELSPP